MLDTIAHLNNLTKEVETDEVGNLFYFSGWIS
jgi:hypothetical protein